MLSTRLLSALHTPAARLAAVPLAVSILVSLIPQLHDLDVNLRNERVSGSLLLDPDADIVVVTVDRDDDADPRVRPADGASVFGANPYSWRETHARLIHALGSLPIPPRAIGLDVSFVGSEQPDHDGVLREAISFARGRGVPVVLAANPRQGEPLNERHWLVRMFGAGEVDLATTGGTELKKAGVMKSFTLRSGPFAGPDGRRRVDGASIPLLLDLHVVSANIVAADVKRFDEKIPIRFARRAFTSLHYRDILDPGRLAEVQDRLGRRIVLAGVESPGDTVGFPFVPDGQPSALGADGIARSYGVFVLANVVNSLRQVSLTTEIEGLGKVALLFASVFLLAFVLRLLSRVRFATRAAALVTLAIILVAAADLAPGAIAPVWSLAVALAIGAALLLLPDLRIALFAVRLVRLSRSYPYANHQELRRQRPVIATPCRDLADIDRLVDGLSKVFVEAAGHTWFEEIPCERLAALGLLEEGFERSRKRSDCIARADFLKECFVGARTRRLRNLFSHANLGERAVQLAREAIAHYAGLRLGAQREGEPERKVELALDARAAYALQVGLLADFCHYLASFAGTAGPSDAPAAQPTSA